MFVPGVIPRVIPSLRGIAAFLGPLGAAVSAALTVGYAIHSLQQEANRRIAEQQNRLNLLLLQLDMTYEELRREAEARFGAVMGGFEHIQREMMIHIAEEMLRQRAMEQRITNHQATTTQAQTQTISQLITSAQEQIASRIQNSTMMLNNSIGARATELRIAIGTEAARIEAVANRNADRILDALDPVAADTAAMASDMSGIAAFLGTSALAIPQAMSLVHSLADRIGIKHHERRAACIPGTGRALLANLLTGALPMALPMMYKLWPEFRGLIDPLISQAWEFAFQPLLIEAPITPDKAFTVGNTLFANAMIMGVGAHLASQLAESRQSLKYMGLPYLAAFMADMAGFSRIAAGTLGVLITIGLNTPMRYWVNEKLRPWLPDTRDAQFMRAKKEITFDKFKEIMGYHGYGDDWIETWERYLWMDPRLFEIVRLSEIVRPPPEPPPAAADWLRMAGLEEGIGPDWWYWMKYGKAGYDYIDVPVLVRATKWLTMRREQTMYLMQVRRLYREGMLDDDEARKVLRGAELADDVIEFRLKAMRMEREYYRRHALAGALKAAFRRGRIDERALINMLIVVAGIMPTAAMEELRVEQIRRYGGIIWEPVAPPEVPEMPPMAEWEMPE